MLNITEEFIISKAPNSDAAKNGKSLVQKGKFVKLNKDKEETLIFGECEGSGSSNYLSSADFINPDNPVFRCSCPSRQFPCKHAIGLMYAYVSGKTFDLGDIPEDIIRKREKLNKKDGESEESVEAEPAKKKTKKTTGSDAAKKKALSQIEGLEIVQKMLNSILGKGIGTITNGDCYTEEKQIKELGNYYISGVQVMMREFYSNFKDISSQEPREEIQVRAMEKLLEINAVCKKGKEYLEKTVNNLLITDAELVIEEYLGRAWKLSELKEKGLVLENRELIQLSFDVITNHIEKEYEERGIWIDMSSGKIFKTQNLRPFKALNYIKDEDSFYKVLKTKELYCYPGEINQRVRWEDFEAREIEKDDFEKIKSFANENYSELAKNIKNQIKAPISVKNPFALIKFKKILVAETGYVIESIDGVKIPVSDFTKESKTSDFLSFLNSEESENQVLLVRFIPNIYNGILYCQPKALITDSKIIRFSF